MMTIKKYFKNITYEASSISNLMKRARTGNAESINVIIDYIEKEDIYDIQAHVTYEAILPYNKIRLVKNHKNMNPLEVIAYTGRRVTWLEKKLPNIPIKFLNGKGRNIEKGYLLMLKLANAALPPQ